MNENTYIYILISSYLGDYKVSHLLNTSIKLNKTDCAVLVTQTPVPLSV